MLIAMGSAFVWAFITFALRWHRKNWLLEVSFWAAYAVLVSSWFVLPLGAVLGIAMPKIVRDCSSKSALLRGALVGIGVAAMAALLTSVTMEWSAITGAATIVDQEGWQRAVVRNFAINFASMSLVCSVVVGVWAARWCNKPVIPKLEMHR